MRIRLGTKIFAISLALLALIIVIMVSVHATLRRNQRELLQMTRHTLPLTRAINEIESGALQHEISFERQWTLLVLEPSDTATMAAVRGRYDEEAEEVGRRIAQALELAVRARNEATSADDWDDFDRLHGVLQRIEEVNRRTAAGFDDLLSSASTAGVIAAQRGTEQSEDALNSLLDEAVQMIGRLNIRMASATRDEERRARTGLLVLASSATVLGLIYAALLSGWILRPLARLQLVVEDARHGRLEGRVSIDTRDELAQLADAFNELMSELSEAARLKAVFGKYVDPRVVAAIEETGVAPDTKGQKGVMTVLMSDLDGFDERVQTMTPEELIGFVNAHLDRMSAPVTDLGGFVEFVGTVVKGFWGPPFVSPTDHAPAACQAALQQLERAQEYPTSLRIGLDSGPLIAANMGPEGASMFTVLGDTVNTAARLQGVARQYGVNVLMTAETLALLDGSVATREIDRVRVVGKDQILEIHELQGEGHRGDRWARLGESYAAGLEAYRSADWGQAIHRFEACVALVPEDSPSRLLLERSHEFQANPPPDPWDGVWQLTSK